MHWPHAPAVEHAARAGSPRAAHWAEAVQAVHLPAAEQMGVAAVQVPLVWHCGVDTSGGVETSGRMETSDMVSTWPSRGELPASMTFEHPS